MAEIGLTFGPTRGCHLSASSATELLGSRPTVKPVEMIAHALRDVTARRACVLDTFLGSGSTLMAAHETGRVCCGIDLVFRGTSMLLYAAGKTRQGARRFHSRPANPSI